MNLNPETLTCIQLLSSFNTVHSVRIRSKITNNIELSDTECVSFYVTEKKPLSALDISEIIPSSVTIEGKVYPTDVVQVGRAHVNPFPKEIWSPGTAQYGPNHIIRNATILGNNDSAFQQWYNGIFDPQWPAGEHCSFQRPLRGGLQVTGNTRLSGYGTLGGIVYDTTDHTTVGITNAHVVQLLSGTNVLNVGYLDSTSLNSGNSNDINRLDAVMHTGWSRSDINGKNRWLPSNIGYIFRPNDTYYPYQSFFETLCNKTINRNPLPSSRDPVWTSIEISGSEHYPKNINGNVDPLNLGPRLRNNTDAGYVKRYMPIIPWPNEVTGFNQAINFIDAAIITCNTISNIEALSGLPPETPIALLSAGYSHRQACFSHTRICTFATTAEIDSLVTNRVPLFKSGAATSALGWPNSLSASHRFSINRSLSASNGRFLSRPGVNSIPWLDQRSVRNEITWPSPTTYSLGGGVNTNRVTPYTWSFGPAQALSAISVDTTITVGGYGQGGVSSAVFANVIEFINPVCAGAPGDSGSLLYGLFNANSSSLSAWKIVGIHFAGAPSDLSRELMGVNDYGYACRIDRVSELLSISAWNGQHVRYTNLNNVKKVEISNRQSDASIIHNGRKYWQTGFRPGNGTKTLPPSGTWTNPLVQPRPLSGHYLLYGTGTGFAWGESNEIQQMFNGPTLLRGEQWRGVYGNEGTIVFGISGNKQLFVNGNNIYGTGIPRSVVGSFIFDWRNLPGRWDSIVSKGAASFARAGSRLFACGVNQDGQLGLGTVVTSDVNTFTPVPGNWSSVVTNGSVSFALSGNALFATGLNTRGELGLGHTWGTRSFTRVPGSWRKVAAGADTTWALSSNGSIFNVRLKTNTLQSAFVLVQRGNFTNIVCGDRGQVFALSGKRVWAYGFNTYGELGVGNTFRVNTFTLLPGNWDKISCGLYHSVALSGDRLFGSGQRIYSQLGFYDNNSSTDQFFSTHTQLSGTRWVDVNCAGNITYALRRQF